VAVELWQTQLAFAIGILGVYAGWKGTISRMTGFYDLAGAVKYLVYGLVSGMLLAICVDRIILSSIILAYLNIFTASMFAVLIGAAEAAFVMFVLARPRVTSLRASPPFGWALGLGIGSMQASYLIYRLFDEQLQYSQYSGTNAVSVTLAFAIALVSCLGHALPASWQGARILESSRVRPFIISAATRGTLTMCLVLSLFMPLMVLLAAPAIALAWGPAQVSWLPSGMTPDAKQAFRRTTRQSHRHRIASDERIRGQVVDSEE
jgi:hypothetical protein